MTPSIESVSVDTPLRDVLKKMSEANFSCLLVMDGKRIAGIITERDVVSLAYTLLDTNARAPSLIDVMTHHVVTIPIIASVSDAYATMTTRKVRRLVIVDDGQHCGLVTRGSLLAAQANTIENNKHSLENRVDERTRELQDLNKKLHDLTLIDPLTGVKNRRAMNQEVHRMAEHTGRYARPCSIALVDVDHFKPYNDHYGHQRGDEAIVTVANTLASTTRGVDTVYRYGGEEFLILLPETDLLGAICTAEHVRHAVQAREIPHQTSQIGIVTCSVGVAEINRDHPCIETTISQADQALYRAKSDGRNCVRDIP